MLRLAGSRSLGLAALLSTGARAGGAAAAVALKDAASGQGLSAATLLRGFSSSGAAGSAELAGILKKELDFERENTPPEHELFGQPPNGFTLEMTPGDTLMTLKKAEGSTLVEIDIQVNNQPDPQVAELEDGEHDVVTDLTFTASVTKGDHSLIFDLVSDRETATIMHVAFEPKDGLPSDSHYTGPTWEEMDEELQDGIGDYLMEKGVDGTLCDYLFDLHYNKEQQEYMRWLENVHGFVLK